MGDRARLDHAKAGTGPHASSDRTQHPTIELHAPDAFDRGAGSEFLAGSPFSLKRRARRGMRETRYRSAAFPRVPAMTSVKPSKAKIGRPTAFAFGFAAISRHGVIRPWIAPIGCALCRPGEFRRMRKVRQRPGTVIVD